MDQVDIAEQMVLLLKDSQTTKSKIDLELIDLNGLQVNYIHGWNGHCE
jgi:hypothetical protein